MRRIVWVVAVTVIVLLLAAVSTAIMGCAWRAHVLAAANALKYQLEALPAGDASIDPDLSRSVGEAVQHHLEVARKAAWPQDEKRLRVGEQFLDWWTGAPCEAAYVNLHEAEIALAQLLPQDQIKARAQRGLPACRQWRCPPPRRRAAETQLNRTHRRANSGPRFRALSGSAWNSRTSSTTASAPSGTSSWPPLRSWVSWWSPCAWWVPGRRMRSRSASARNRQPPRAASPSLCRDRAG